jgi:hypothetical protein
MVIVLAGLMWFTLVGVDPTDPKNGFQKSNVLCRQALKGI